MKNLAWIVTLASFLVFFVIALFLTYEIWFVIPVRIHTTAGNDTLTIGFNILVTAQAQNTTALNEITAQSVPPMINGIATSTSIIIGFSATVCGIIIGSFARNNRKVFGFLIGALSSLTLPLLLLFWSFRLLAIGEFSFGMALKSTWNAFLYSFFILICIFTFAIFLANERNPKLKKEKTLARKSLFLERKQTAMIESQPSFLSSHFFTFLTICIRNLKTVVVLCMENEAFSKSV